MLQKQNLQYIILILCFVWLCLMGLTRLVHGPAERESVAAESAYDRILRTNTIRCGYILYPPAVIKDPNSGELSGIAVEIMNKIAARLSLKIDWTEETTFATNVQGLQSNRYDAVCVTYWQNPAEGKFVGFSTPFYYSGLVAAHRCPDGKTPQTDSGPDMAALNDPAINFASIDGTVESRVIADRFPNAHAVTLPNVTGVTEMLLNVASRKADYTMAEYYQFALWNKNNPEQLLCPSRKPVTVFANVIALPIGDMKLKSMIDTALIDILHSGEVDQILDSWESKYPHSFYRIAPDYQAQDKP